MKKHDTITGITGKERHRCSAHAVEDSLADDLIKLCYEVKFSVQMLVAELITASKSMRMRDLRIDQQLKEH